MESKDLNRLKIVLVEKIRTAKWLAQELGISPVMLSKWCCNTTQLSLQTIDKIANILEVHPGYLLIDKQ